MSQLKKVIMTSKTQLQGRDLRVPPTNTEHQTHGRATAITYYENKKAKNTSNKTQLLFQTQNCSYE